MKYKKIKTLKQYNKYCDIHEKLFREDEDLHEDELELLEILIEEYDIRMMPKGYEMPNAVELLRMIIKDNGQSQADLAKEINSSPQLISDILNYRRNISKIIAAKLAANYSMQLEAFARPYDLEENRKTLNSEKKSKKTYRLTSKSKVALVASEPKSSYRVKRKSKSKAKTKKSL